MWFPSAASVVAAHLAEVGDALTEVATLEARIAAGPDARGATAEQAVRRLVGLGVAAGQISVRDAARPGLWTSLGQRTGRAPPRVTRP